LTLAVIDDQRHARRNDRDADSTEDQKPGHVLDTRSHGDQPSTT
jgi:hypothetical protein